MGSGRLDQHAGEGTLVDRVAGGRTIQIVAANLLTSVSVAPLKKVLIHDQECRLTDDEVMSTAAEHRVSVSPANDHPRLRAMLDGHYELEDGDRVAYLSDPDGTDTPTNHNLVGRLVDDDTSNTDPPPGESLSAPLPLPARQLPRALQRRSACRHHHPT